MMEPPGVSQRRMRHQIEDAMRAQSEGSRGTSVGARASDRKTTHGVTSSGAGDTRVCVRPSSLSQGPGLQGLAPALEGSTRVQKLSSERRFLLERPDCAWAGGGLQRIRHGGQERTLVVLVLLPRPHQLRLPGPTKRGRWLVPLSSLRWCMLPARSMCVPARLAIVTPHDHHTDRSAAGGRIGTGRARPSGCAGCCGRVSHCGRCPRRPQKRRSKRRQKGRSPAIRSN